MLRSITFAGKVAVADAADLKLLQRAMVGKCAREPHPVHEQADGLLAEITLAYLGELPEAPYRGLSGSLKRAYDQARRPELYAQHIQSHEQAVLERDRLLDEQLRRYAEFVDEQPPEIGDLLVRYFALKMFSLGSLLGRGTAGELLSRLKAHLQTTIA